MLGDLLRALRLVPRRRRWQWAVLVPLAFAAAVLESLGAGVILALGTLVADPSRVSGVSFVSKAAARLPATNPKTLIMMVSAGVLVFYLARGVLLTLFAWVQETVVQRTALAVAGRAFHAYLTAPYVFHLHRRTARIIHTIGHSVEIVFTAGLGSAVSIATEGLTLCGLLAVLAFAAPLATLVSVSAIGIILLVPLVLSRRVVRRIGGEIKTLEEVILHHLQQCLASFKEVRVMGAERHFEAAFTAYRRRLAGLKATQSTLTTSVRVFMETTFLVALLLAVIVVTAGGKSGGDLIGLMALYAYVGFRVVPSANRLALNFTMFQSVRPHLEGLSTDLELLERSAAGRQPRAEMSTPPFADGLQLESVTYRYERDRDPALDGVSLTIRRGESIGVVGATGSGKSTLIDVVLGLLEPQSGRVLVDGRDIRVGLRGWQQRIGYVPQTFDLLDDTVRRNVAFGRSDAAIDDARVESALRLAHLAESAALRLNGLDTVIGEHGARLSGGERQRVAIARALYHDADVLIFDEATSALDYQTEQAIVRAIEELRGVKTLIVVAHRLSTVRACDRLVLLQNGRVTGEGSYSDLFARHPAFREMVTAGTT